MPLCDVHLPRDVEIVIVRTVPTAPEAGGNRVEDADSEGEGGRVLVPAFVKVSPRGPKAVTLRFGPRRMNVHQQVVQDLLLPGLGANLLLYLAFRTSGEVVDDGDVVPLGPGLLRVLATTRL